MPRGRRRIGSRSRSRRSSARRASPWYRAKLDINQQTALRNVRHEYLLRAMVSYGLYRLSCIVRQTQASSATTCAAAAPTRCARRRGSAAPPATFPADELVWADLCALLTDRPAQVARALDRAHGGAWLPRKLQARQTAIRQALAQLDRQ